MGSSRLRARTLGFEPKRSLRDSCAAELSYLQAVADFSHAALRSSGIGHVVDLAMNALMVQLDVDYAKLLRFVSYGSALKLEWGLGWRSGYLGEAVVPPGTTSQAGYTLLRQCPIIVEDVSVESRFAPPSLLVEHNVRSGMSVTVDGTLQPFGVLGVHCSKERVFTEADVAFLQCIANTVSATYRQMLSPATGEAGENAMLAGLEQRSSDGRVLNGWKEIANYLRCGVRTVQRWELSQGLPVHRPASSSVVTSTVELDRWVRRTPVREWFSRRAK